MYQKCHSGASLPIAAILCLAYGYGGQTADAVCQTGGATSKKKTKVISWIITKRKTDIWLIVIDSICDFRRNSIESIVVWEVIIGCIGKRGR